MYSGGSFYEDYKIAKCFSVWMNYISPSKTKYCKLFPVFFSFSCQSVKYLHSYTSKQKKKYRSRQMYFFLKVSSKEQFFTFASYFLRST